MARLRANFPSNTKTTVSVISEKRISNLYSLPDAHPVLVRQNTFTKDESVAAAAAVSSATGFKMQRARMVGGNIVRATDNYEWSAEDDEVAAFSLSDLRADVRKPQDNLKMEGAFQNRHVVLLNTPADTADLICTHNMFYKGSELLKFRSNDPQLSLNYFAESMFTTVNHKISLC